MAAIEMPTTGAIPIVPARDAVRPSETSVAQGAARQVDKLSGVIASVGASVVFATLFCVPGLFVDLPPYAAFGWRMLFGLPCLALILTLLRQWGELGRVLRRIRRKPALALVLLVNASIFGFQTFLFAWGPMSGQGLAISMGYFLLPLVLVALGFVLFHERLSRWGVAAVAFAVLGVTVALIMGGTVGWATFAVALGYPPYLILRRRFGLGTPAALLLEMLLISPVALTLVLQPAAFGAMVAHPLNWIPAVLLGVLTAVGFSAFALAQRDLTLATFGMLGYIEPVLLVVVSTALLAEPLSAGDALSYGAIALAIVLLSMDGVVARRRRQGRKPQIAVSTPA